MIALTHFAIIGAASRNVGKTEFACRLIEKYSHKENVIGLKITAIDECEGKSLPKGGLSDSDISVKEHFIITEETRGICGNKGKDTVRMLEAGADRVYWLRVLREYLGEGIIELLKMVPEEACAVCESNSAREVIEPGVFLVVRQKGGETVKASCKRVEQYADRQIEFDNYSWDLQPEQVVFRNGTWRIEDD